MLNSVLHIATEFLSNQGCPDDVILPTRSTNPVLYSWIPPVFLNNRGPVDVEFDCSATIDSDCQQQDGFGTFSVGDTEVMYIGTDTSGNQYSCNFTVTVTGALNVLCFNTIKFLLLLFA